MTDFSAPHHRHSLSSLAGVGLTVLALTACGSSGSTSSTSRSTGGSSSAEGDASDAGRIKLIQCLRQHGVNVPDDAGTGSAPPAGIDQAQLQSVLDGPCKSLQTGAFGNASSQDQQDFGDSFAKFASCMRRNGVDVPDLGSGGVPSAIGIDTSDPKVQAATRKCQSKLPSGALPGGAG